jgi:hypothetical protein
MRAKDVLFETSPTYEAIQQSLAHAHHERHHQGLTNHLIARERAVGCHTGPVACRKRLGGLLSSSHREAAGGDAVLQPYEFLRGKTCAARVRSSMLPT